MKFLMALLLGVALGVGLALLIGWVLFPAAPANTQPDVLRPDYKEEYVRLLSIAYQVDGDLDQARQRLAVLNPEAPMSSLVTLTERWILQDKAEHLILPLIRLARDLGVETTLMQRYVQGGTL